MTDFVATSYNLAEKYHKNQKYGEMSYMQGHLLPVSFQAEVIAEGCGLNVNEIRCVSAVSYLHDIVEDTDCSLDIVKGIQHVPELVPKSVECLTKKGESHGKYLDAIVRGGIVPIIVKLADSMCNHRASLASGSSKRILRYSSNIVYLSTALVREIEKRKK